MNSKLFLLLSSVASFAAAAPVSANPSAEVIHTLDARKWINDCGLSTFENQSTSGSPHAADCHMITTNIAGGGTWTIAVANRQSQLVQFGTCAFGVTARGNCMTKIGNSDIIDLINSSVDQFQWNGLVSAKGSMSCQCAGIGHATVEWGIYHN